MQLALRPRAAAAGVTVIVAGLIHVTPVSALPVEQRAIELAATEDFIDVLTPIDTELSTVIGAGEPALASVTDALISGGGAIGAEALPSAADLQLLDPAFWEAFWNALLEPNVGESPWLMLTGAVEELPVVGPLLQGFGLFVVFPVSLLVAYAWSEISQLFGIDPSAAAAEGLETGLSTALTDITSVFGDAAGALDPTALVQDVSTALDPSALTSILDLNPIADIATAVDPAAIADIGTVVDAGTVADLGAMLTSLIP